MKILCLSKVKSFLDAYNRLVQDPKNSSLISDYLSKFPSDKTNFEAVFCDHIDFKELYDGYEFIDILKDYMSIEEDRINELLFSLMSTMKYYPDAPRVVHKLI